MLRPTTLAVALAAALILSACTVDARAGGEKRQREARRRKPHYVIDHYRDFPPPHRAPTFHWWPHASPRDIKSGRAVCEANVAALMLHHCTRETRALYEVVPHMPELVEFVPKPLQPVVRPNMVVPRMSDFDPPDLNGEYERRRRLETAERRREAPRPRDLRPVPQPFGAPYEPMDEFFSNLTHPKNATVQQTASLDDQRARAAAKHSLDPETQTKPRFDVQRHGYSPEEGETTDPPKNVPSTIGKYRLIRNLGWGSFARVELAIDTRLNRTVALKFTGRTYTGVEEWFRREITVQRESAKNNPFVVPILDIYEHPKYLVCAMEAMDTGSLMDRLRVDTMTENEMRPIIQRLTVAVALMHRNGMAHKDIKPHNMIFSSRHGHEHPMLTDFGLSVFTDDRDIDYYRYLPWGTSWYMAPEQWFPLFYGEINLQRSDTLAIGATLYHALCGHPPDRGQGEEPMLDYDVMMHVSPEASDFLQRTMWPYPEERIDIEDLYWHPWINPTYTLEEFIQAKGYPRVPERRWNPGWVLQ